MTSNFDDDERALSRALHGRVDPLTDSPLGLDDVQGKARSYAAGGSSPPGPPWPSRPQ